MNRALHLFFSSTSGAPEKVRCVTSFQTSSVTETGNTICMVTTLPPGFQPRLILHQESISGYFLLREIPDMAATTEWLLLVALRVHFWFLYHSFLKSKETGSHPQIPLPVRRPDTGYGIPAPPSLRGAGYQPSALQSDAEFWREVMEQASKRSSFHEGGLSFDPMHKGTDEPIWAETR
jgi:hypothetical protein